MAGAIVSAGSDIWGTPRALYDALDREFDFTIDLAADRTNHKHETWLGPGGYRSDGLAVGWDEERGFCNPPFSNVKDWTRKAYYESRRHGALVVMLLKAATERRDFHQYVWPAASEVRFVAGRLKYEQPGKSESATFPSCIVIWRPGIHDEGPALTACDDLGRLTRLAA